MTPPLKGKERMMQRRGENFVWFCRRLVAYRMRVFHCTSLVHVGNASDETPRQSNNNYKVINKYYHIFTAFPVWRRVKERRLNTAREYRDGFIR
jgi:hypothetical protein